ncbi:hypothetical protein GCM10023168_08390 [Fodinibacter luteus]|uniref:Transposase n=1 Tax=Fodinibacter luteus TaxID=552064 RepID=A0ABP8K3Y6_9MICO
MGLEDVADELYGLAPEAFTAARNTRAKEARAAGDAELADAVQSLRKPTTGAWLLNELVRRHADELEGVLELGTRLRAAQGTLGAAELRDLDRQRRALTRTVAEQAVALGRQGGRRVSAQVAADVEETLRSAMVDAAAGAALATGRLVDTFSASGIEPVDLARVVALPPASPEPPSGPPSRRSVDDGTPDPAHDRRLAAARQALEDAESALRAAREVAQSAVEQVAQAGRLREGLESERDEVLRTLRDLEGRIAAAVATEEAAARGGEQAAHDEAAAAETVERLREAVTHADAGRRARR